MVPAHPDAPYPLAEVATAVQRKVMSQTRLGASVVASMRAVAEHGVTVPAENLRLQLEAYCLSDHLVGQTKTVDFDERVDFTRPATWWDHFKAEQVEATSPLWRWVARRWPSRMVTETRRVTKSVDVTFEAKALYPYSDHVVPEFGKPVIVESYSTES